MLIRTPAELRLFLPTHVMNNLDSVLGFLDNSEHDFLAERIGEPLLKALNNYYASTAGDKSTVADTLYPSVTGDDPWQALLVNSQRCIVFDAFARAADIQMVSVNGSGINVTTATDYDTAPDQTIKNYKLQLSKEAHAASNRLLIQLEDWQKQVSQYDYDRVDSSNTSNDFDPFLNQPEAHEAETHHLSMIDKKKIVSLWKKSSYYYFADGLLFNTATEFNKFINIYESREKFIQLLPDIRYCQETYLENEIGEQLLLSLIEKHKQGSMSRIEAKAYTHLQRALSLRVEARSSMFKRPEAKDEAIGYMHIALDYIVANSNAFDVEAMQSSPLYVKPAVETNQQVQSGCCCNSSESYNSGMYISSMI